jgi:hypothetical protein
MAIRTGVCFHVKIWRFAVAFVFMWKYGDFSCRRHVISLAIGLHSLLYPVEGHLTYLDVGYT